LEQEDPDLLEWFSQKSRSDDAGMAALVDFMLARVQPPADPKA
jgi:succinate dehydrogenase flavin-adding protein (antitoxin of CptAB toxin-antitoxin module)